MATISTDSERTSIAARDVLPPQIEERIYKIRQRWAKLREEWNSDQLIEIHTALSELSEYAAHEGYHSLADAAFSAEVYLSSFVGTQIPMTPNQRESADSLLAELTADIRSSANGSQEKVSPERSDSIFLLGPLTGPMEAVANLIQSEGLDAVSFESPDQMRTAMQQALPAMIVTEIGTIPAIEDLLERVAHLRKAEGAYIPIIYLSDQDNLEMRIRAIRAGGEAFFTPPYDADRLVRRLTQLKSREEPHNRILIVEDDVAQADCASSILAKAGFETAIVSDPMQTLERIREFGPDLIIMDIYMPEVDGIELTSVIREYNEYAGIPIIFLSGEQDTDRQVDALSVGGDDFVTKPIRPKHLIAIVKNRIRRSEFSRQGRPASTGLNLLGKNQLVERLTTLLATDPMRAKATAVLLIAADQREILLQDLGAQDFEQMMMSLAQLFAARLGERDAIARLDDATLAIAIRRSDASELRDLCSSLHEMIATHTLPLPGADRSASCGIGVALASNGDRDANNLLKHAETALQGALDQGNAETVFFDEARVREEESGTVDTSLQQNIADAIRTCLEEDAFHVLYQPLLDLQLRGSENYEIMIRVPTPKGDLLTPDEFRQAAEQSHSAEEIDKWLIVHAVKMLRERRTSAPETRFFLNQSGASILDPGFPEWLADQLRAHQVVGTGLVLDFPLSILSHDLKAAKGLVGALHQMDIAICISQFPEKSPAFKLLRYVSGDYIRIAKRLLKSDRQTIMSVVNEAHSAKAKVIISHIDDPRSIDLHWSSGGDLLQGDFIQPPIDNLDYDFSQVVI